MIDPTNPATIPDGIVCPGCLTELNKCHRLYDSPRGTLCPNCYIAAIIRAVIGSEADSAPTCG